MKISYSFAVRDRAFSNAMRRIRHAFLPLLAKLGEIQMKGPSPKAILIGVVDEMPDGSFKRVRNSDGYFQELVGCTAKTSDAALKHRVFVILRESVSRCPLEDADRQSLASVFDELASGFVASE